MHFFSLLIKNHKKKESFNQSASLSESMADAEMQQQDAEEALNAEHSGGRAADAKGQYTKSTPAKRRTSLTQRSFHELNVSTTVSPEPGTPAYCRGRKNRTCQPLALRVADVSAPLFPERPTCPPVHVQPHRPSPKRRDRRVYSKWTKASWSLNLSRRRKSDGFSCKSICLRSTSCFVEKFAT